MQDIINFFSSGIPAIVLVVILFILAIQLEKRLLRRKAQKRLEVRELQLKRNIEIEIDDIKQEIDMMIEAIDLKKKELRSKEGLLPENLDTLEDIAAKLKGLKEGKSLSFKARVKPNEGNSYNYAPFKELEIKVSDIIYIMSSKGTDDRIVFRELPRSGLELDTQVDHEVIVDVSLDLLESEFDKYFLRTAKHLLVNKSYLKSTMGKNYRIVDNHGRHLDQSIPRSKYSEAIKKHLGLD